VHKQNEERIITMDFLFNSSFCLPFGLRFQLPTSLFELRRDKTTQQVGKATPEAGKPMFIRHRSLAEYPISGACPPLEDCSAYGGQSARELWRTASPVGLGTEVSLPRRIFDLDFCTIEVIAQTILPSKPNGDVYGTWVKLDFLLCENKEKRLK
jgi:hypothetical protein